MIATIALTRAVPASMASCELTHVAREPIDLVLAGVQHTAYEKALQSAGLGVVRLPTTPHLGDSVFVEDTAIVLDEVAVLMRPGAVSRRPEVSTVGEALTRYRPVVSIEAPATIDGGDVLRLGRTLWVGLSSRTTREGAEQLRALVACHGYSVQVMTVRGALHLKTAVTQVADGTLLVNPAWIDARILGDFELLAVDEAEPFAANAVWVNGRVIHSTRFPRTQERLRARGIEVIGVDASELAKAEGGVTCCSLLMA